MITRKCENDPSRTSSLCAKRSDNQASVGWNCDKHGHSSAYCLKELNSQGIQLSLVQPKTTFVIPRTWLLIDSRLKISSICNEDLTSKSNPLWLPSQLHQRGKSDLFTLDILPHEVFCDNSSIANIFRKFAKLSEMTRNTPSPFI